MTITLYASQRSRIPSWRVLLIAYGEKCSIQKKALLAGRRLHLVGVAIVRPLISRAAFCGCRMHLTAGRWAADLIPLAQKVLWRLASFDRLGG